MNKTTKLVGLMVAGLVILLITTRPNELSPPLLIVPFLLIFLCFFLILRMVFAKFGVRRQKNLGLAMLISGLFVILLAMQSLGQLTIRDAIMLAAIFIIAYFYVYRRARS
jgi:hypothetical protein